MQTKLELYQKVTPLAHLGIWERNMANGTIYWNAVVREIYEVEADFKPELERSLAFYTAPGDIRGLITKALTSGQAEQGDFHIITAKSRAKCVRVRTQAAYNNGTCTALYGTIEDISIEKQLIAELAERGQQFHHAFEYAPIGMALVSPSGQWIKVNRMICELLGYEKNEFLKKTFQELTYPEDLDADLDQMNQLLDGHISAYSMDKRYFHRNGNLIWALLSVTLVRDQENKPLYFVSHIKDITERKKASGIIRDQNDRLLNFAHIVSHNLRSHVGNIQMLTAMIGEETDTCEKDKLIGLIGNTANMLQETLSNLHEVVDVNSGGHKGLKSLGLVKEIRKTLAVLAGSLKQTRARVSVTVPEDIRVCYDQAYLESILLNLLTNAVKYRDPERRLQVTISVVDQTDRFVLEIGDNGLGIDLASYGNKLFGMYQTFHSDEDARGVGLFLVKSQAEAMGGGIRVESTPGKGSVFRLDIMKK